MSQHEIGSPLRRAERKAPARPRRFDMPVSKEHSRQHSDRPHQRRVKGSAR